MQRQNFEDDFNSFSEIYYADDPLEFGWHKYFISDIHAPNGYCFITERNPNLAKIKDHILIFQELQQSPGYSKHFNHYSYFRQCPRGNIHYSPSSINSLGDLIPAKLVIIGGNWLTFSISQEIIAQSMTFNGLIEIKPNNSNYQMEDK